MIELARLLDAVTGDLDPEELHVVEEHLLGCAACARVMTRLLRLGASVAALVRDGRGIVPTPPALLEHLERAGLVTRVYAPPPGGRVPCTVDAADIYVATHLTADLTGVRRVNLAVAGMAHGPLRLVDLPFARSSGRVSFVVDAGALRSEPSAEHLLQLLGVGDDGAERLLAEYTMEHSAFRPAAR